MSGLPTNDIHQGDAVEILQQQPDSSIHMAMCSPPYYGLRDYGSDGQIGLEDSLDQYIKNIVEVARELRRVLRPDGSWWLNLGDSFAGSGGSGGQWTEESNGSVQYSGSAEESYNGPLNSNRFRRKTKMLVPHRVAIALQDAGWIVRGDCVWTKPNPMPQSVKDRLNETKEFIFHLTPEPDYWFDLDAIREPYSESTIEDAAPYPVREGVKNAPSDNHSVNNPAEQLGEFLHSGGKNPGDVFEVSTKPFPDAHFAVYPPELCERPIKASSPPEVCAMCGTPYGRDVEEKQKELPDSGKYYDSHAGHYRNVGTIRKHRKGKATGRAENPIGRIPKEREFNGWEQFCDCDTDETEPGIVLDPFAGAGTTCLVAKRLGRRFIGIDLNSDYVAMAQKRVGVTVDEPHRILEDESQKSLASFANDGGSQNP